MQSDMHLIQLELDDFQSEWNSHTIRHSNIVEAPPDILNVLFNFPEQQVYNQLISIHVHVQVQLHVHVQVQLHVHIQV